MVRQILALALLAAVASATYTWDSCGTKLDRLMTKKLTVDGKMAAGQKATVTAVGATNLHVPLETGAWQVRVYETGVPKETHTEVGDLMKALKFLDAKNTTFSMSVSFTLPAKQASGTFDANIVAVDQSKADYLCLDVKYSYAALEALALEPPKPTCWHEEDEDDDHKCFEACAASTFKTKGYSETGACPAKYSTKGDRRVVTQCADGMSSLRWCPKPLIVNVTFTTKSEAGAPVELLTATPTCWHEEDATDHKCFEACAPNEFITKGYSEQGTCPAKYSTKDTGKVVTQCADGVTSLRWCPASQVVNVTFTTKGEAGALDTLVSETLDTSVYCMKDPSKKPPYYCHVLPLPAKCTKDSDCVSPWYSSYCVNKFQCKEELPPTCTTDKDCQR